MALVVVFVNAPNGVTKTKSDSANRRSIQAQPNFSRDPFLNLLDADNLEILNHFGASAASYLQHYIVKIVHEIEFLGGDSQSILAETNSAAIEDSLWHELISKSKFLRSLHKFSPQ